MVTKKIVQQPPSMQKKNGKNNLDPYSTLYAIQKMLDKDR